MMQITNFNGFKPNVLHFHEQNKDQLPRTFEFVFNDAQVTPVDFSKLAIVSTWTDEKNCCLLQQCKRFNIPLINCVPEAYDSSKPWFMPNKIHFFLDALDKIEQEYVMFLDGYDVLLTHLDDIIKKYEDTGYDIVFGPSCNNYPDVFIDNIPNRINLGIYRYFNAGCCIGKRESLKRFYEEALPYLNIENPWDSEQFVLRQVFKNYSSDLNQKFVTVDNMCYIFQSMGVLDCISNFNTKTLQLNPAATATRKKIIVTGSDGFIGKELVKRLREDPNNEIFPIDIKSGLDAKNIDFLTNFRNIDIIYHLAAETSVFNTDIERIIETNVKTFAKIAMICAEKGIKLVYASSSTANNENTTSMYGLSKRFNEEFAKIYCPGATGVRLHNVYGKDPREGTLLWHLLNDEMPVLYNKGENRRCFTYIDDAVNGLLWAGMTDTGIYNCVNKEEISVKEFADMVGRKYKLSEKIRDKDNKWQRVNDGIPLIPLKYTKVVDGIKLSIS